MSNEELFKIEDKCGCKDGMIFDRKVTFYDEKYGNVEAEYYYLNGACNYLLSWGFTKDSLGELRKSQARKAKKPYFSFKNGWYKENKVGAE